MGRVDASYDWAPRDLFLPVLKEGSPLGNKTFGFGLGANDESEVEIGAETEGRVGLKGELNKGKMKRKERFSRFQLEVTITDLAEGVEGKGSCKRSFNFNEEDPEDAERDASDFDVPGDRGGIKIVIF